MVEVKGLRPIAEVSSNQVAISTCIEQKLDPLETLTPGIFSQRLYASGVTKKVIDLIYFIWSRLSSGDIKKQRLYEAFRQTHDSFLAAIFALEKGAESDTVDFANHFKHILKHNVYPNLEEVVKLFDKVLERSPRNSTSKIWLETIQRLQAAFKGHHIRTLQLQTVTDMPKTALLELLKSIKECRAPNASAENKVEEWLQQINPKGNSAKADVVTLHKAIKDLVRLNQQRSDEKAVLEDTARIEWALEKRGCDIFKQVEPKQRKLCEAADKTKSLLFVKEDVKQVLSVQAIGSTQLSATNQKAVFSILEEPKLVAVLYANRAMAGIEAIKRQYDSAPYPLNIQVDGIESKGRFALKEKLEMSLVEYPWPASAGEMASRDKLVMRKVAEMLSQMRVGKYASEEVLAKDLRLNKLGTRLASTKIMQEDEYNFVALEKMIYDVARGGDRNLTDSNRRWVYTVLMEKSGLLKEHARDYFKKYVEAMLLGKDFDAKVELSMVPKKQQAAVFEQARQLKASIEAALSEGKAACSKKGNSDIQKDELIQEFKRCLLTNYEMAHCGGFLWPSIVQDAINTATKKN